MKWRVGLAGGLGVAALVTLGMAVTGASPVTATSAGVTTTPSVSVPADSRGTVGPVAKPTAVHIPAIGVNSSLIPLGIQGRDGVAVTSAAGEIEEIPTSMPDQAGFYSLGFLPGQIGSAAILGHVDGNKKLGVFHNLGALKAGDQVVVDRKDGSHVTFTIKSVETILKKDFNPKAEYGPAPDAELHLISCGGKFLQSTHQYAANVIADAVLTSTS